jgi:two-component system sensor histidine kinase HupT/HoxJ
VGDLDQTPQGLLTTWASSKERVLLKKLLDHYCGVYLTRVLEGVVHNLNNPLQILWVRSEQLEKTVGMLRTALQSEAQAEVVELAKAMESRTKSLLKSLDELNTSLCFLTKDFLFERRSKVGRVKIDEVIEDTLSMLNANMFFKHHVKKSLNLDNTLPPLTGRHTDFCIIMISLIQNALDAMANTEEKHLTIETCKENAGIAIRVRDTGCGIPAEDGQDIFKDCLTIKKGMGCEGKLDEDVGVGLSLVSLLLEDYHGQIACKSVSGSTTFTVHLPCHNET